MVAGASTLADVRAAQGAQTLQLLLHALSLPPQPLPSSPHPSHAIATLAQPDKTGTVSTEKLMATVKVRAAVLF